MIVKCCSKKSVWFSSRRMLAGGTVRWKGSHRAGMLAALLGAVTLSFVQSAAGDVNPPFCTATFRRRSGNNSRTDYPKYCGQGLSESDFFR